VELEDGIGGMVHISDLSWTKRYSHPSEFTSIGAEIDVVVLEIDKEGRKLSLGHKQIEENPWDTFESVFPVGSYHEVVVIRRDDKGAIVQLPYGLEAYAPMKHMRKEDGSMANAEDTLTVKVIEFNRDDKRILVSHQRYLDDIKREADDVVRREERKEVEETDKVMKSQNARVERATLGELDVFSQLKEQLQQGNNTGEPQEEEQATAEPEVTPVVAESVPPAKTVKKSAAKKEEEEEVAGENTQEPVVEAKVEKPKAEKPKEEKPKEEKPKKVAKSKAAKGDDLKKIEGVGPKIAEILTAAGIDTFEKIAGSDADALRAVLEAAGSRYKMFDPTTWPEQAKLAAAGDWDGLKALQGELSGGRR